MLRVLKFPDPFLFKTATIVTSFDAHLEQQTQRMLQTMYAHKGVGLAATQVGYDAQVFVMDCHSKPYVFVNPKILHTQGPNTVHQEGCLSFPFLYVPVERPSCVQLAWQDIHGNAHQQDFEGLEAICVQHEMDHLQGIVFLKHLSSAQRNKALRTLEKLQKHPPQPA